MTKSRSIYVITSFFSQEEAGHLNAGLLLLYYHHHPPPLGVDPLCNLLHRKPPQQPGAFTTRRHLQGWGIQWNLTINWIHSFAICNSCNVCYPPKLIWLHQINRKIIELYFAFCSRMGCVLHVHHEKHGDKHPQEGGHSRGGSKCVDHQGHQGKGHHHVTEVAENWHEHI